VLQCNVETWTRERPADAEHGKCCFLYVSRLGTGVHVRCVVKVLFSAFVFCNWGFCSATYWADVNGGVFFRACPQS